MTDANSQRDPLEALIAEFMERQRQGENPSIDEYIRDHPELAADIRELFPTVAAVERLKVEKEQSSGRRATLEGVRLEKLGDFRIIREIGRGGMGIVYEAEQESLGRHVAVKVLPRQFLLDRSQLRRFEREARTAARLHHTNIVPVFGVGEQDGYHYYVMQFIRGVGLDEVISHIDQVVGGNVSQGVASPDDRAYPGSQRTSEVVGVVRAMVEGCLRRGRSPSSSTSGGGLRAARGTTENSDSETPVPIGSIGETPMLPGKPPALAPVPQSCHELPGAAAGEALDACGFGGPGDGIDQRYWRSVADIGSQAAHALEYAHAQGTLHRDIKPANLLIDSHGVVWVADFGLAKAAEQDLVSHPGDIVGTLRYMAPERFSGESDARSDVYSLGLTLYELAALRPAYDESDRSRLIRKVTDGELTRPRKLNPGIPRDLETIVLKAVARDPAHRYQSAGELAADLQCFLEDRPILARRAGPAERLWRWSRRNRATAALAGTALGLLVLVAVVAGIGYARTKKANIEVKQAMADLSEQKQKAEATSDLAMEALDTIFDEFAPNRLASAAELTVEDADGDELEVPTQPVLSKEAAALLEHMLGFYDRLAESGGDEPKLLLRVADANRRVGEIRQRLGHFDQAQAAYSRAVLLYEQLEEERDDDGTLRTKIAGIHNELGSMYLTMGRPEEWLALHLKARAMLVSMPKEACDSPEYRYELARTCFFLGKRGPQDFAAGGPGGGPVGRPRAPGRPGRPGGFGRGPGGSPPPMQDAGRVVALREKVDNLNRATDILLGLVDEYPAAADYRHLLALCYREMPPGHSRESRRLASEALHKATEILQSLVTDFPDLPEYRYDLSETYAMPAGHEGPRDGGFDQIEERLKKAIDISEALVAEHPNIPDYAMSQVHIRHKLAGFLRRDGDRRGVEMNLRKAVAIQSSLVERFPNVGPYKIWLAIVQESLARALKAPDELDEARSLFESSISTLIEVSESDAELPHVRQMLGIHYRHLAEVLVWLDEDDLAAEARRKTREFGRPDERMERVVTGVVQSHDGAFEGYTLFAPLRSTITFLIDMQGYVVHSWEADSPPGHAVYLLNNGNLLRCAREPESPTFHGGGIGGRIQEFDWDGHLIWEFDYSDEDHCQHHDIEPMPNGNILVLAWERKNEDQVFDAGGDNESPGPDELWPDHIVEVRPEGARGGAIVWEWHVWDHLIQDVDEGANNYGRIEEHPELVDINFDGQSRSLRPGELKRLWAIGYLGRSRRPGQREGRADWTHANSIAYHAEFDQIMLSVLHFNEIWVIDHSTTTEEAAGHTGGRSGRGGDLLYRWGNPQAYGMGGADAQQLFAQHDAQWITGGFPGAGHILVFNNGRGRPGGDYSSVVEITPPVDAQGRYTRKSGAAFGPARPAWDHADPDRASFFSGNISGAQRLANGNTLICAGERGRLVEVNREGRVVWEYVSPFGGDLPEPGPPGGDRGRVGLPRRGPPPGPPPGARGRPRDRPPPGRGGPGGRDERNAMFRATRLAPDHPGLIGKDLTQRHGDR